VYENAEVGTSVLLSAYLTSSLSSLEFHQVVHTQLPQFPWRSSCRHHSADMAGPTKSVMLCKNTKSFTVSSRTMSSRTFPRQVSITSDHGSTEKFDEPQVLAHPPPTIPKAAPLSILPLSSIIRSLAITSISSSPVR
jgi:hypothetical protein